MAKNKYTKGELAMEAEANVFACYLLMPDPLFTEELDKRMKESEEEVITNISKVFDVPQWAVVMRLQLHHQSINNLTKR